MKVLPGFPTTFGLGLKFQVNADSYSVNEGDTVTFTIEDLAPSTQYNYALESASDNNGEGYGQGNMIADDFVTAMTGTFTTNASGVGTVAIETALDETIKEGTDQEGTEQFRCVVKDGTTNEVLGISPKVSVADTSFYEPTVTNTIEIITQSIVSNGAGTQNVSLGSVADGDLLIFVRSDNNVGFPAELTVQGFSAGFRDSYMYKVASSEPASYDLEKSNGQSGHFAVLRNATVTASGAGANGSFPQDSSGTRTVGTTNRDNSYIIGITLGSGVGVDSTADIYIRDHEELYSGGPRRYHARTPRAGGAITRDYNNGNASGDYGYAEVEAA